MMVAEIVGGTIYGSIAVVADGWHMPTHAAALGIAALAYRFARKHARDPHLPSAPASSASSRRFPSAVLLALISCSSPMNR
jgi:Co/Zn/Cd efflux system component